MNISWNTYCIISIYLLYGANKSTRKGESMKEKYYEELMEIFLGNDELQKEHSELFNVLTLIVEHIKKTQEIEELNKKLTELNK